MYMQYYRVFLDISSGEVTVREHSLLLKEPKYLQIDQLNIRISKLPQ